MMFYLTTLNLSRFLTEEAPVLGQDEVNPQTLAVVEGWKHFDYLCMVVSKSFQVVAIIKKLPTGWKDFKNYLKHKRKEMIVKEVALRLRIEEDSRKEMNGEKNGSKPMLGEAKSNVVEHGS
ncbi:hypothetical protein LIER_14057 [Lithospermum erythrorhizon]|uniref:Uncharacterized protein n=1 Tax=Lithospermum erythrorhizon TaxID=34254 RepID=A0AAV3PZA4_LITER